ncbi:MAG: carbohydrate binding domain-containing protein [Armatimonadetes bacterium]|nr:carbohydrate binding domain-containing protein [Armatimonadota bacterium]
MVRRTALLATCLLASVAWSAPADMFPFVLPWDDDSPGITDLSGWLDKPAGRLGPVRAGADGHLYTGDRQLRLFGVDQTFSANFPTHEQAEKVAGRLAKFGVNIMRFHIMDMARYPRGLLARDATNTRDFDPEALERLDYYTAQLKARGIYTYLCLLNYRPFAAADGLPKPIEELGNPYQGRHVPGFWDPAQIALQKEYAQRLLSHRNAYTQLTYAEDPAVAFVEINNENGLIHAWLSGTVDGLPAVFREQLQARFAAWLRGRYASTEVLRAAWARGAQPLGEEMLTNGDFGHGLDGWNFETHAPAVARATVVEEAPPAMAGARSVCLDTTTPGAESWHVRLQQGGHGFEAGRTYVVTGWARADRPMELRASLEMFHEPWHVLGALGTVALTTEWQPLRLSVRASEGDREARLVFDPPRQAGRIQLAGLSLRPGGVTGLPAGESLEAGTVTALAYAGRHQRSVAMVGDWCRFLWETERAYWRTMHAYVRDELKVRSLVIGTVVGCSTPNLMAEFGVIDGHAYWEHPVFPGRAWDADNWVVGRGTMVNARGGVLTGLAAKRVLGQPFCITEYGHPAPNPFLAEAHLLRAAYGSLQDWDYLSASRYAQSNDFDIARIRGFFDIDQHPVGMLTMVPAAAMYLRGDVSRARREVITSLSREREIDLLPTQHSWDLVSLGALGPEPQTALLHRMSLATEGREVRTGAAARPVVDPMADRYVADTGELDWDLRQAQRGVVTVNTARSKAVIGYGAGRSFELGTVAVEPGPTSLDGWSAITVTAMTGELGAGPARLLITACANAENTGMVWKNAEKTSVGRAWGTAPTLAEGVPARLTLPWPAARVKAWALDERGQRRAALPVSEVGGHAVLAIGPEWRTLWYEVAAN